MNRLMRLRKKLIAKLIKAVLAVAFFIALSIAGFSMFSYAETDIHELKGDERQLQGKYANLQQRNERAINTLELYNKLTKDSKSNALVLNRENVTQLLNRLKDKYRLDNLSLNLSPLEEKKGGVFEKKTGTILTAKVSISFTTIRDTNAYAFMDELVRSFSGYLNISNIKLIRPPLISEVFVNDVMKRGNANIFQGQIEFDWLGLRVNEAYQEQSNAG